MCQSVFGVNFLGVFWSPEKYGGKKSHLMIGGLRKTKNRFKERFDLFLVAALPLQSDK